MTVKRERNHNRNVTESGLIYEYFAFVATGVRVPASPVKVK